MAGTIDPQPPQAAGMSR